MKTYCLSYESKNKQDFETNKLRDKIVQILHRAGAENLTSTVGSTIFFVDIDNLKFKQWVEHIENNLIEEIDYYLCSVENYNNTNIPIHVTNKKNSMLCKSFQESVRVNATQLYC